MTDEERKQVADRLAYVVKALAREASDAKLDTLAYLLNMAFIEATSAAGKDISDRRVWR